MEVRLFHNKGRGAKGLGTTATPFLKGSSFTREFWQAQFIGWGFLSLFGFCIRLFVFDSVIVAAFFTLVVDSLGLCLTSLMAHQPFVHFRAGQRLRGLAMAALWCIGIAWIMTVVAYVLRAGILPHGKSTAHGGQFVVVFMYYLSVITAWTLAYLGIRAESEVQTQRIQSLAAETRALRIELESLHLQIAPHFLFNALNTLISEIGDRPAIAEEMTQQLAAYLRYSLEKRDQYIGPVSDELDAVRMYTRIQALRFGERFSYLCSVDPAALGASIPHMAIQCLVENAIKHGLQAERSDFQINVAITQAGDELFIEVDNPSGSRILAPQERSGTGLANMRRRLELRYPERHSFTLTQRNGRTIAALSLKGKPCSV